MNEKEFRKELLKIMPGYKWTVHRKKFIYERKNVNYLSATGIQSSGSNRLSTLGVNRRDENGVVEYEVKSSGYGIRAPWLSIYEAPALARALRGLQKYYESMAQIYENHAGDLQRGRCKPFGE